MRVLVTGATGFVGRHVVMSLLASGHQVKAVARDVSKARAIGWPSAVEFLARDLHQPSLDVGSLVTDVDVVMHLAWPGLPNYKASHHFEVSLLCDYSFLKSVVQAGVRRILVTGTCLEYGFASGPIPEDTMTAPTLAYPLAKDTLHRFLLQLAKEHPFTLQWARLFYMYGVGQNPKSLLSQLERAIDDGSTTFDMSGGEQLRDYLPVTEVARILVALAERNDIHGPINVCSGRPVSVRNLVEARIAERKATVRLNLGVYPYLDYEPMAFWGSSQKLGLLDAASSNKVPAHERS